MRKTVAMLLALALLCACAAMAEEGPVYGPGLSRAPAEHAYDTAEGLAGRYGVALSGGAPLYAPAHPQPLNAYMVAHADCEVGIDRDGMYPVREKGLVPEITGDLNAWMDAIEAASGGSLRFVGDPDDADILVVAKKRYVFYGDYSGEGVAAEGYSCAVELSAWQLSNPAHTAAFSARKDPEESVSVRGSGSFWEAAPEIAGTAKLADFADAMLGWYGFGASNGATGDGVKAAQQALIDRGFLEGLADGSFGPKTEAAVMALQAALGLEATGAIDNETLVALYFEG